MSAAGARAPARRLRDLGPNLALDSIAEYCRQAGCDFVVAAALPPGDGA